MLYEVITQLFIRGELRAVFGEIIGHTFRRWFHGFFTGTPVGRADVTVLFKKLQGVNDPERFINISAQRQVVYQFVPDNAIPVNQEQAPERNTVRKQHFVIL